MTDKNDTKALEAQEARFITVMSHLEVLDREVASMVNNFNDGQGSLAFLSFENPDTSASISTKGFTYGPAYTTTIQQDGQLVLVTDVKNPQFFVEDAKLKEELAFEKEFFRADDQEEESFEQFQNKMSKQKQRVDKKENEMKELQLESQEVDGEDVLNRFGNINIPVRLYAARNSFNKVLKSLINIANEQVKLKKAVEKN